MEPQKDRIVSAGMLITIIAILLTTPILAFTIGFWFFIPFGLLFVVLMYFSTKVEHIKREYDVQTYKEIIAFTKGEALQSTEKIEEKAKRPYQKLVFAVASGLIATLICGGIGAVLIMLFK
ncbi:hypothetical protein [Butyrivibrio sp. LC3010]|uniref:hypothetical protein n=1 Tax=Butyrivibrio sp. LC3010 TaxID=1280680 RepID=UPI000677AC33|nr:hypothetical protein [Butyrivibrio sp. LC3010]